MIFFERDGTYRYEYNICKCYTDIRVRIEMKYFAESVSQKHFNILLFLSS